MYIELHKAALWYDLEPNMAMHWPAFTTDILGKTLIIHVGIKNVSQNSYPVKEETNNTKVRIYNLGHVC